MECMLVAMKANLILIMIVFKRNIVLTALSSADEIIQASQL